ncbi:MAG TPA: Holliday junction branch migration protein RuvA [Candidatus Dormibacteraeota bacterium]|nr:Holliday junction branch migration protein RuvA [Candidatus Dormibacteraeota bacterium]
MIAALRGTVARVDDEWAVIEVGGVGYQVYVHPRTAAQLMGEAGEVSLQIHTVVREDAISLFGFLSSEELIFFRYLLTVERIGPKAALAILARAEWPSLVAAIMNEDHALLASVPGIGTKTAQRIVLELKGRVDELAGPGSPSGPPAAGPLGEQAAAALVALGFPAGEARRAVAETVTASAGDDGAQRTLEDVVKSALQRLSQVGVRSSSG